VSDFGAKADSGQGFYRGFGVRTGVAAAVQNAPAVVTDRNNGDDGCVVGVVAHCDSDVPRCESAMRRRYARGDSTMMRIPPMSTDAGFSSSGSP
jgi:hypothetical protein